MRLSELSPSPGSKHSKKRVGRGPGSGWGKTAARGHKGQNSRAGGPKGPGFEGGQMPLTRRIPKRGFNNIFRQPWSIVNLRDLKRFAADSVVDEAALKDAGLVDAKTKRIKLLAVGEVTVPLIVKVQAASAAAKAQIEAAGGRVEVL
ncbi:MAG: 50S ribosomal protein L15 [Deltaproteobacteria bacterium]|nr:50S ribosomal protein L15 [Deltaproteobacteria bacterium]